MPAPGWTGDYDWAGFIPFDALPSGDEPALRPFRQRQQQDRARQLSLFPEPRLGFAGSRRADQCVARRKPGANPGGERRDPGRHLLADGEAVGAADDAHRSGGSGDRAKRSSCCSTGIFTWTATRWRRCCSPHGCANSAMPSCSAALATRSASYWDLRPRVIEAVLTERPDWCADPKRPRTETCAARLAQSLVAALAELRQAYGDDMAHWQWGRAHVAVFPNPVFSRIPVLRDWFDPSIATARRQRHRQPRPEPHPRRRASVRAGFGAGLRIITDLASPADARMIVTPGQSGNPLSGHFADLMRRLARFRLALPGPRRRRRHPGPGACT